MQGLIGGDSGLSDKGKEYAKRLSAFINNQYPDPEGIAVCHVVVRKLNPMSLRSRLQVWTSTLKRTIQTAQNLGREIVTWRALDEIDAGVCDSMTYAALSRTRVVLW